MKLSELSIRRPVFTIVLSLLLLLLGALSLMRLPVREYPAVDPPTVSITTAYPGAAAEIVQAQVTEPIEEAVNSVAGIVSLTSISREGASVVTAEFSLDTNLDTAASDVRDQLSRAARFLPVDVNPPILNKANADSSPIFGVALSSQSRSQLELGAIADSLRERLQTVPGIAGVEMPAEKRYAMRMWMDPERLAAYGISPLDVRAALARESVELPSGRIEGASIEFPVKTLSRLNSVAEFNDLILKRSDDRIVRFSDVGYARRAEDGRHAHRRPLLQAAAGRQPDRHRQRAAASHRAGQGRVASGCAPGNCLRQYQLRAPLVARGGRDHLRGLRAGGAGGVRIPAGVAHHTDSGTCDSGVDHRCVLGDLGGRVFDQRADTAGSRARHWPGGG
jgi:hypothetical protein